MNQNNNNDKNWTGYKCLNKDCPFSKDMNESELSSKVSTLKKGDVELKCKKCRSKNLEINSSSKGLNFFGSNNFILHECATHNKYKSIEFRDLEGKEAEAAEKKWKESMKKVKRTNENDKLCEICSNNKENLNNSDDAYNQEKDINPKSSFNWGWGIAILFIFLCIVAFFR